MVVYFDMALLTASVCIIFNPFLYISVLNPLAFVRSKTSGRSFLADLRTLLHAFVRCKTSGRSFLVDLRTHRGGLGFLSLRG